MRGHLVVNKQGVFFVEKNQQSFIGLKFFNRVSVLSKRRNGWK
jgi:hypothetical protein